MAGNYSSLSKKEMNVQSVKGQKCELIREKILNDYRNQFKMIAILASNYDYPSIRKETIS